MKKKKYLLVISISILIVIGLVFWLCNAFKQQVIIIEGVPTKATNQSVLLKIKPLQDALYAFNGESFSKDNTYLVESNIKDLKIEVKLKNKQKLVKKITIDQIDKQSPIVNDVRIEKDGDVYRVLIDAIDKESGIASYQYWNGTESVTTKGSSFTIPVFDDQFFLKIIDKASNEILVDKAFYQERTGELIVIPNVTGLTNQAYSLTVLKEKNYLQYSFSENSEDHFSDQNTYIVNNNGTIFVKVKTDNGILSKEVVIANIDKEKPTLNCQTTSTEQAITVNLNANDNKSTTFMYRFGSDGWTSNNSKTYPNDLNNALMFVKDEAGNEAYCKVTASKKKQEPGTPPNPPSKTPPSLNIQYPTTPSKEVLIQVTTDTGISFSYNYGPWQSNTQITLYDNVNDYSIRVKDKDGLITEKKITINHIQKELTMEEKNKVIINEIKTQYGFKVDYGPDADSFWYRGEPCTVLLDHEKANQALQQLKVALPIFPKDFFRIFQGQNGYRITLFADIPYDTAGVASYEFGDDNRMILDVGGDFVGRVFYHETYHIMENYITQQSYGKEDPFRNWASLNPSSFIYGSNGDSRYTVYDLDLQDQNHHEMSFITPYAKTNEHEDRAELYADLMFRVFKKDYMNNGYGVNEKAKALATILRSYFPNSTGAAWERYISW